MLRSLTARPVCLLLPVKDVILSAQSELWQIAGFLLVWVAVGVSHWGWGMYRAPAVVVVRGKAPSRAPYEGKRLLAVDPDSFYKVLVPAICQPLAAGVCCVVASLAVITLDVPRTLVPRMAFAVAAGALKGVSHWPLVLGTRVHPPSVVGTTRDLAEPSVDGSKPIPAHHLLSRKTKIHEICKKSTMISIQNNNLILVNY